ncbi:MULTISPECIES: hypothetical protein [Bacillus]|uniref:DUF2326 domain-containing protein n=4 Tax=Bacillus pseudomycoides TaxID=64104 RepID=A0ABD6T3Q7_9BACI|nr:hypothetical protein [Bacillus pseudomycoides]EEM10471.1 hypothetical protein bmyco0003_28280 [Bacillus pseudomycoides]KFN13510.1 hypothetical protein DJ94_4525 [Bacillus pseudomycoides]MCR8860531.1 hypothetical protein [Bacillus pseudomycoides]MDR4189021.1 hypothetical protein [Bacillus pseudomycoides]MED0856162.1 hypothetical protein [Bacillus pseudomycoides]
MENLEIILTDFNKRKIDKLIYGELKLSTLKLKSSHLYNNTSEKDLDFSQVKNIKEILSPKGTGNIFLEELKLGISLKNVVIVFSFDEQYGDIVFNFPENEILKDERNDNKLRLKKLVHFLVDLKKNYDIPKVIIGYEPATDEDTLLIEINNIVTNYDKKIEKILS